MDWDLKELGGSNEKDEEWDDFVQKTLQSIFHPLLVKFAEEWEEEENKVEEF